MPNHSERNITAQPTPETSVFNDPFVATTTELVGIYVHPSTRYKQKSAIVSQLAGISNSPYSSATFQRVFGDLVENLTSKEPDEVNQQRLTEYRDLANRIHYPFPSVPAPQALPTFITRSVEKLNTPDILKMHTEIFEWVKTRLNVDPSMEPPYLWISTPQILGTIGQDIQRQTGYSVDPGFLKRAASFLAERRRVGLTIILDTPRKEILFPGIIFNNKWADIITNPDRILVQENINSVIMRSDPIYQLALSRILDVQFGQYASNVRDLLISFGENVGIGTTINLARELGTRGEYKDEHEYLVDLTGKTILASTPTTKAVEDELLTASFSRILNGLMDGGRYKPGITRYRVI